MNREISRKGVTVPELVIEIIIVLAILGFILYWLNGGFSNTKKQLDQFSACGGAFGSLGGKEGRCSTQKSCDDVAKAAGHTDWFWQYVGANAFGCPDPNDKTLPPKPNCCIALPSSSNPTSTKDAQALAAMDGSGDPVLTITPYLTSLGASQVPMENNEEVALNGQVSGVSFSVNSKKTVTCTTTIKATSGIGDTAIPDASGSATFNSCSGVANFESLGLPVPGGGSYVKYEITTTATVDGQPAKLRVIGGSTTATLSKSVDKFTGTLIVGAYNVGCTNTNAQPGRYCDSVIRQGRNDGTIQSGQFAGSTFVCTIDRATGVCTLYLGNTAGTGTGFRSENFNAIAPCTSVVNEQGTESPSLCKGVQAPCTPSSLSPSDSLYVCLPKAASTSGSCLVVYVSAADQDKAIADLKKGSFTYQGTTYSGVTIC